MVCMHYIFWYILDLLVDTYAQNWYQTFDTLKISVKNII